jgi:hypothetical protein
MLPNGHFTQIRLDPRLKEGMALRDEENWGGL